MTTDRHAEVLALIPARSGSKSIPDKNIRRVAGKPLLAHSIAHALAAPSITRTIVSTDSEAYAALAREYGAEVPFLRPAEFAQDQSTDLEVFTHALRWLAEHEGYRPDLCVHLRPTYPVRKIADIEAVIQILVDRPELHAVRSVAPAPHPPMKMWFRDDDGRLSPVVATGLRDAHSLPRQLLPPAYLQNACVDAVRTAVILEMRSMTGTEVFGYLMDDNFDIDHEAELRRAEAVLATQARDEDHAPAAGGSVAKTFCFDIDGVIATLVPVSEYHRAGPRREAIDLINGLYERGHHIVLFTARGSVTGIDWAGVTRKQLQEWGVRHHQLIFGKPAADYYIDDKMIALDEVHTFLTESKESP